MLSSVFFIITTTISPPSYFPAAPHAPSHREEHFGTIMTDMPSQVVCCILTWCRNCSAVITNMLETCGMVAAAGASDAVDLGDGDSPGYHGRHSGTIRMLSGPDSGIT